MTVLRAFHTDHCRRLRRPRASCGWPSFRFRFEPCAHRCAIRCGGQQWANAKLRKRIGESKVGASRACCGTHAHARRYKRSRARTDTRCAFPHIHARSHTRAHARMRAWWSHTGASGACSGAHSLLFPTDERAHDPSCYSLLTCVTLPDATVSISTLHDFACTDGLRCPTLGAGAVGHGSPDLDVQLVCARPPTRE